MLIKTCELCVPASVATVINQTCAEIYRLYDKADVAEFKAQALSLLTEVIAFDHAYWHSCALETQQEQYLVGYDYDVASGRGRWATQTTTTLGPNTKALRSNNLALNADINHKQLYFEIGFDKVRHQMVFTRDMLNQEFDQFDCDVAYFIAENMVGAFDLLLQHRLAQMSKRDKGRAICDGQGRVLKADSEFVEWSHRHFPDWTLAQCVPALSFDVKQNQPLSVQANHSALVHLRQDGELHQIQVYQDKVVQTEWDKLTQAEFDVVWRLAQGLTPKQVAKAKGLSVSTVGNQIDSVHQKLGFKKNTEVIESFIREGVAEKKPTED